MNEQAEKSRRGRKRKHSAGPKEQNRLRGQKFRQKRKDYIELLEQQVEELQKEVSSLTSKLEECKKNLDIKSLRKESNSAKYKFLEDENFFFDGLVNLITENPDMVKTSMHYQTYESSGSSSESRIKFIKEAFETIIDYCVPDPTKI